jgi:acetoacetyl-CoA reductase
MTGRWRWPLRTPDEWDRVIQVNLSDAVSRAILQPMLDRDPGRIINISPIIGETGNTGQDNNAATKSGRFGLTMSLAQETARKGITVNSVAPGYISSEMVQAVPQETLDKVIAKIPVGRLGEPDEVAHVVEFLADPDSTRTTWSGLLGQRRPVHVSCGRRGRTGPSGGATPVVG